MFKTKSESQPCDLVEYKFNNKPLQFRQAENTLWLTQNEIARLFEVDRTRITRHLQSIFNEGELDKNSVCAFSAHTANDGKQYNIAYYNLDAIISVGYRVSSKKGTMFRQWVTKILKEHLTKPYEEKIEQLQAYSRYNEAPYNCTLIKKVMKERGVLQKDVAKMLGITKSYFCECLSGHRYNSKVEKWAKLFLGEYDCKYAEQNFLGISASEKDRMIGKVAKLTRNSLCGDLSAYKKIKVFFDYVGHSLLNELEENLGTRQRIELIEE